MEQVYNFSCIGMLTIIFLQLSNSTTTLYTKYTVFRCIINILCHLSSFCGPWLFRKEIIVAMPIAHDRRRVRQGIVSLGLFSYCTCSNFLKRVLRNRPILIQAVQMVIAVVLKLNEIYKIFYTLATGDQRGHFYNQFRRTQANGARRADDVSVIRLHNFV